MPQNNDGSYITNYFGLRRDPNESDVYSEGLQFMLGQVNKIHYVDDLSNKSKQFVEYDVVVDDADGGRSTYTNLLSLVDVYGTTDFSEFILEANEVAFSKKLNIKNQFTNKNGSYVVVGSINGSLDKPFIIGCLNHPRMPGAKRSKGIHRQGEFRGIQWEINKDGELSVIYKGVRSAKGLFTNAATAPTSVKIDNTGAFALEDKENKVVKLNRADKTVAIEQYANVKPNDPGQNWALGTREDYVDVSSPGALVNSIKLDKANKKITFTAGTDSIIEELDGLNEKLSILLKSGIIVKLDGSSDSIELEDSVGGKLKISNGKVGLGRNTTELVEQVIELITQLEGLITEMATETHIGNLLLPTSPPQNAAQYTAIKALITAIKTLLQTISGGI